MGRNKKTALEYFPVDVDVFHDIKVRKLIKYQGGRAFSVYAYLLCCIYKNGYYMQWDDELPFIISEATGFEEAYIHEVIKCCMAVGLLSKQLYEEHRILSSKGIQERYKDISLLIRRKASIDRYSLISSEETNISSEEKLIHSEEIPISSENKQQNKLNKNKLSLSTLPDGQSETGERERESKKKNKTNYDKFIECSQDTENYDTGRLIKMLVELKLTKGQQQQILILSNFGRKGGEVFGLIEQLRKMRGINQPAQWLITSLRNNQQFSSNNQ